MYLQTADVVTIVACYSHILL